MPTPEDPSGPIRLAIIGAGPIAGITALIAAARGHEVALWSPRGSRRLGEMAGDTLTITGTGALVATTKVQLLPSADSLIDWPVIVFAIPGDAYPAILPQVLPLLTDGHNVIFSGALSLAPLWLGERAEHRGVRPAIAAWGTTLGTGRINAGGAIKVSTIRSRFEVAARPANRLDAMLDLCRALFGDVFAPASNLLVPLLSNINPVAHAGEIIPNLSRIEKGEVWSLFGNFDVSGTRIADAIDQERLAIAQAFDIQTRSLVRHYHLSYHVPEGPLLQVARDIASSGRVDGPISFNHRHIQEDMPFGLAVYEVLGTICGVPTPILSAAITLLGAACDRPMRSLNPLIKELGLEQETPAGLAKRCAGL
jgi:opine dehydrogenase